MAVSIGSVCHASTRQPVFAALLGSDENGRWLLAPSVPTSDVQRVYRKDTLILETRYETPTGTVKVTDYMPIGRHPVITRIADCVSGSVKMHCDLVIRFDYGKIVPWVQSESGKLVAIAGPDALQLESPLKLHGEGMRSVADFHLHAGERVPFVLSWFPSHEEPPPRPEPEQTLAATQRFWRDWCAKGQDDGPYRDHIVRSLLTLKSNELCAHRRDGGGRHDFTAGSVGRQAKLGLPILLVA